VYVNGVLTSLSSAQRDLATLKAEFYEKSPILNVSFINGYNESHIAGIGDWIKSVEQSYKGEGDIPVDDYDLKNILLQIHDQVKTKKILLVGHSQGTFYTNALYGYLTKNGVPEESIKVYNLATPASFVAGNGKYLTSANDRLIIKVRELAAAGGAKGPLISNILIPLPAEEINDPWGGHHFSSDYLSGAPVRIIGDINSSLGSLSTDNTEKEECFTAPPQNFSYKLQNLAFTVADPLANATYNGVSLGYNTALAAIQTAYAGVAGIFGNKENTAVVDTKINNQGASVILANEPIDDFKTS